MLTTCALLSIFRRSDSNRIKHDHLPIPLCRYSSDLLRGDLSFCDGAEVEQQARDEL